MLTLCKKYSKVEWSAYCLHEKVGKLFNEKIVIHAIYLMNVGTTAATDFSGNTDVAELLEDNPELGVMVFDKGMRIFQCKVHSHNEMSVFYSGMDQQDLEDNSKGQDLYVSLVVNNKMEFFAKACRWVKTEKTNKTVQVLEGGKYIPYTYEVAEGQEKMVQECNVSIDMTNPSWFNKRLTEIKPAPPVVPTYNYTASYPATQGGWKNGDWHPKPTNQVELFQTEDEYNFEDELVFVFGLPKKCTPKYYLRTSKIDIATMLTNLAEYSKSEEDDFFDNLAEWVLEEGLQESLFYNQVNEYLTNVEF